MPELSRDHRARPDALVMVALALMAIGVVMVGSATASLDRSLLESLAWREPFGRQVILVAVGLVLMLITARAAVPALASQRLRRRLPPFLFLLTLVCLVAALLPGWSSPHRGSQRWLQVTAGGLGLSVQPSEFGKLALVACLASLLTERRADLRSLGKGFLPPAVCVGLCVLLVGKEDFGTGVLFAMLGGLMLLAAGCRLGHVLLIGVVGVCGLAGLLFAAPYRLARIMAHLRLWEDPLGAGYQPLQSLTTIASGGWLGVGLGGGIQKYGYVPESHSDFIFSVVCEETGVLGAGLVIALFCVFIGMGIRTMWSARTRFERLLAFGITSAIGWQAAMNIAVVTVVTPTTGISLPLISAGGSGLLTFSVAIGLLGAIAARARQDESSPFDVDSPPWAVRPEGRRREVTAW